MKLDDFENALRSVLAPDPHRDPVDFLEHNIKKIPYSPQSGAFRISNSPWLAEPLRALIDPEIEEIAILGNVQSGKSWVIEGASCVIPILFPGPTLILQDIDRNAKDYLDTRLRILWSAVPALQSYIGDEGIPKSGAIQFRDNTCWVLGANNQRNLQGRSIRFLLGDEIWQWPSGSLFEAFRRITAYKWKSKTVLCSQGGVEKDEWSSYWETTTRSVWSFECPDCKTVQPYKWEQIVFPKEARTVDNGWDLDLVRRKTTYKCCGCDTHFADSNKVRQELNATGRYVMTNPNAPKSRRGYSYNALAMQWGLTWGDLAVECIEAKQAFTTNADNTRRQQFIQKRLAQTYKEEPDEINLSASVGNYKLEEEWSEEGGFVRGRPVPGSMLNDEMRTAPDFVRMRFMTVDVQRRGFYWVVRSWNGEGASRLIQCGYSFAWGEIIDVQKKFQVNPHNTFVDSGDQQDEVLTACANNGWHATRGDQRNEFTWKVRTPVGMKNEHRAYSPPVVENIGQKRAKRTYFSNLRFKDTLSLLIRQGKHTRADDAPEAYLQQMQSEKRTITNNGKPIWEQIASRDNHFWDCEVMQMLPALGWRLIAQPKNKDSDGESNDEQTTTAS
jgi:hypothetical protein